MTPTETDLPLVTVVTPSYNQGRFIRETIESVLSQDYPSLEYIVIDGGSTDDTLRILEEYRHWLSWLSERDRGQAHAVNKGWRRGEGRVLAWLNSDDVYLPGAIRTAVDYLIRYPQAGMVYGEAYRISEEGRLIDRYPTEAFEADRLIDRYGICQPAAFIRREILEDVGYLDESLNFCIDYDLWIRLSRRHPVGYIPEYLAKSRLHKRCKTMSQRVAMHKEALVMLHRHYGFVPPTWLGGYARERLVRRLDCSVRWQRALFILGMVGICGREFVRYNSRLPLSEAAHWMQGLRKGIKKTLRMQANG